MDVDGLVVRYYRLQDRAASCGSNVSDVTVGEMCAHCGSMGKKRIAKKRFEKLGRLYDPKKIEHTREVCVACEKDWRGSANRDAKSMTKRGKKHGSNIRAVRSQDELKAEISDIGKVLGPFLSSRRWHWPARAHRLYVMSNTPLEGMPDLIREEHPHVPWPLTPREAKRWINEGRDELGRRFEAAGLL